MQFLVYNEPIFYIFFKEHLTSFKLFILQVPTTISWLMYAYNRAQPPQKLDAIIASSHLFLSEELEGDSKPYSDWTPRFKW